MSEQSGRDGNQTGGNDHRTHYFLLASRFPDTMQALHKG
jgi:hypothetical protein